GEIDFVVVREGTEGPYVGNGGAMRVGTPHEVATEVSVNTAFGVERVVRDAFARAQARPRKKLTLVHKHNVLVNAGHLWRRTVDAVSAEYPEVTVDYLHVDAATIFMATDPSRFDVIVTDNLFGDIIPDLAAAITGGIGLAASGNVNPDRTFPSMFEPVHGSAPDIAGQQKADPTAAVLSVALLLDHLAMPEQSRAVEEAVVADMHQRSGPRSTTEIGDALAARGRGRPLPRPAHTPPRPIHTHPRPAHPCPGRLAHRCPAPHAPRPSSSRQKAHEYSNAIRIARGRARRRPVHPPAPPPSAAGARTPPHPGRTTVRGGAHRPHGTHYLHRRRRVVRSPRRALYAVPARSGRRRAALRPGGLRRAQGLPAPRRLGVGIPPGEERRPAGRQRPALGAAGAARGGLPRFDQSPGARRYRMGAQRSRHQPVPAAIHDRLRTLPRR